MANGDPDAWATLTLDFNPEQHAFLAKKAEAEGLSIRCYCVQRVLKHLPEDAPASEIELWQPHVPAILRRNGCENREPG